MRIMLVDDSEQVLEELSNIVESIEGLRVVGRAQSEKEAIKIFRIHQPEVICLDIRLKKGNGINILRIVKNERPSTIVLMLTNYPYPQFKKKCEQLGANYFFDKSTELSKAVNTLKELN